MTDVAVKNSPATELDNAATEPADESVSGTQLNLTTDDLAQLLDIKEAQRDRARRAARAGAGAPVGRSA